MNTFFKTIATAALLTVVGTGSAMAVIAGSSHDMNSAGTYANATNNLETCVYCHAPHNADGTNDAPLWNRIAGVTTFTPYTSTLVTAPAVPGSASLACLSCHDGATAIDNVVNGPGGSGGAWVANVQTMTSVGITGAANVGNDLSNDHPIGIEVTALAGSMDAPATITSTGGLTLYTNGAASNTVECASCHNPHSDNILYLRKLNTSSLLCLTCHLK